MSENGSIDIDTNTQQQISNRRLAVKRLNDEIMLILSTILNVKGKSEGNYQANREFTKLEIVKEKENG